MKTGYQKYKVTSVQSASREKLLLMMYEACIRFVKQAIQAIETNNRAERGLNIGRAYDIVLELNNTLDHQVGGDIASNLEQLYMFITEQLTQANATGDPKHLENALKVLEILHQGWVEAVAKLKKEESVDR